MEREFRDSQQIQPQKKPRCSRTMPIRLSPSSGPIVMDDSPNLVGLKKRKAAMSSGLNRVTVSAQYDGPRNFFLGWGFMQSWSEIGGNGSGTVKTRFGWLRTQATWNQKNDTIYHSLSLESCTRRPWYPNFWTPPLSMVSNSGPVQMVRYLSETSMSTYSSHPGPCSQNSVCYSGKYSDCERTNDCGSFLFSGWQDSVCLKEPTSLMISSANW